METVRILSVEKLLQSVYIQSDDWESVTNIGAAMVVRATGVSQRELQSLAVAISADAVAFCTLHLAVTCL